MEFFEKSNIISLFGTSGAGKSEFGLRLNSLNYGMCSIDIQIEKAMEYLDIKGVSHWLGKPFDGRYKENEKFLLNLERNLSNEILEIAIRNAKIGAKSIIDFPGSVAYLDLALLKNLRDNSTIVYLQVDIKKNFNAIFERFRKDQDVKPFIYLDPRESNSIITEEDFNNDEQLKEYYRNILEYRQSVYERWADITIPSDDLHNGKITPEQVIGMVQRHNASNNN